MSSDNDVQTAAGARCRVLRVENGQVLVINPAGTSYELHLAAAGNPAAPSQRTICGLIRATARKVWTVPSGGNFIAPIFGPPRIVQGRIKALHARTMLIQAGAPILVSLPQDQDAMDLANGPLAVGMMINATLLPGAAFEAIAG